MKTIQAVAGAPDTLEQIIERLKTQSLALQKQRDDLLEAAGLLEIYRDDGYTCKKCQDTGYVGAQKCECFQKLLRQAAFDALGAAHPQDCRFSNFSLDYYSVQPLPNGVVPPGKDGDGQKLLRRLCAGLSDRPLSPAPRRRACSFWATPALARPTCRWPSPDR